MCFCDLNCLYTAWLSIAVRFECKGVGSRGVVVTAIEGSMREDPLISMTFEPVRY